MRRFIDNQTYLPAFNSTVLVECPRCGGAAEVRKTGPRLSCLGCGHVEMGRSARWRGMGKAIVKRKCGRCGRLHKLQLRTAGPHPATYGLNCFGCGATTLVDLTWRPDPNGEAYDPHFAYPLWLQTPCAGQVFWAYNAGHLAFLSAYVEADLRQRVPNANGTLASRLPRWMKRRKSRAAVRRGVSRLQAKLMV